MYRIEVRPGEETVFRNIEELATGIRNGFITPRARIWHAASQKWLPVAFHPHYKKALAGDFTPAAPAPQPSLAAMPTPVFTPVPAPAPLAIVALRAAVTAPPPVQPTEPETVDHPVEPAVADSEPLAVAGPEPPAVADPEPPAAAEPEPPAAAEPEPPEEPPAPWRHSPVEVFEAVRPEPEPELVLPKITYPEVAPMEDAAELPTARRSRRAGGRPLLLIGSAAALVLGAQMLLRSRAGTPGEADALAEPAPAREQPVPALSKRPESPAPAAPKPVPSPASAPRASAPAPAVVMTPGPAFAPSVRARPGQAGIERQPAPPPALPAHAAAAPVTEPAPSIAPAPEAIELEVPALPASDSLAPSDPGQTDSLAIKRILKAVSGKKPVVLPGQ